MQVQRFTAPSLALRNLLLWTAALLHHDLYWMQVLGFRPKTIPVYKIQYIFVHAYVCFTYYRHHISYVNMNIQKIK